MNQYWRHSALLLAAISAGCGAKDIDSGEAAAELSVASTQAALDANAFRAGCDVILGEGSGPTLDECLSYYPESIRYIDFVTDIIQPNTVEWRLELPPGERLRVLRGCDRSSAICTLAVTPRCDGDTRVYRVHVRNNGVSKTITATVPRADCQTPSPTPSLPLAAHPECAAAERGKLCNFVPGALQADQCDGNGHCVDCSDNGGCDETSYCVRTETVCVSDTTPSTAPPLPPPPQPLPGSPTQPPKPGGPSPSYECAGAERGKLCNFFGVGEADQCDGNGLCVDCVNNGGCDESSACTAQQVCVSIIDPPTTPTTPTTPPDESYETLLGDVNGDGRVDVYVRPRAPQSAPAFVLVQQGGGTFALRTDVSGLNPAAMSPANIPQKQFDFNVDGGHDLYLQGLGSVVSGALDTFVFLERGTRRPLSVRARDAALETFFRDLRAFINNREYFNTDVLFFKNVVYQGFFLADFLSVFGATFNGVGFAPGTNYQDSTRFPHPVCAVAPFPCQFFPGQGWAIFTRIVFAQDIYDYSRYPATSIEAARITVDLETDSTSPQELVDLFARVYLAPVGGDPDVNNVEPYEPTRGSLYWVLNEIIQLVLTRYVTSSESPAPPSPVLELRAHPVGAYFVPYFHASVHLNRNQQPPGSAAASLLNEWYSAFPSKGPAAAFSGFGGRVQRRFKDITDAPDHTFLMGDFFNIGVPAELRWAQIRARDFDNDWFAYCLFPETLNCQNVLFPMGDVRGQGFNSNSFAFGLTAARNGFPLDERRKNPGAPAVTSAFNFPGSVTRIPASAFQ